MFALLRVLRELVVTRGSSSLLWAVSLRADGSRVFWAKVFLVVVRVTLVLFTRFKAVSIVVFRVGFGMRCCSPAG